MGTFEIHIVTRVIPYAVEEILGAHIRIEPVPLLAYSWICVITDMTDMKEAVILPAGPWGLRKHHRKWSWRLSEGLSANPSLGGRGALCHHPNSAALEQFMISLRTGAFHLVLAG